MILKERLTEDLKAAMKSGDTVRRDTISLLRGVIRKVEIDRRHELSNQEVLSVLSQQAKQRRDAIEQFRQGNRLDLAQKEESELAITEAYLPRQLTDEEITERAKTAIAKMEVSDMKGLGKVMGWLTQEMKGVADGKRISNIVRGLLSSLLRFICGCSKLIGNRGLFNVV